MVVMTKRKLRPVDARPPQTGRRDGHVEVVFRTPVMGFRDDVVIRVRSDPEGARVDLRSTSRYGRHDFGANAARIASLSDDIEDAIASIASDKPPPRPAERQQERAGSEDRQASRKTPLIDGGPSVATCPRATRSSMCASTEKPAAFVRRGSSPI